MGKSKRRIDEYMKEPYKYRFRAAAKFELRPVDPFFYGTACGVYKLLFGEKYYIGTSMDIAMRVSRHQSKINLAFKFRKEESGVYKKILEVLYNDISIVHGKFEILEECHYDWLCTREQEYLDVAKDDPNCLNISFISRHKNKNTY